MPTLEETIAFYKVIQSVKQNIRIAFKRGVLSPPVKRQ